jgi:hypothetical protein
MRRAVKRRQLQNHREGSALYSGFERESGQSFGAGRRFFRFLRPVSSDEQTDAGHGRVETHRCWVINDLSQTEQAGEWKGLQCLVKVESVHYFKCSGKEEKDTRLYLSSVAPDARLISSAVRFHRLIENSLHWVPDVAFDEDNSRKRSGFAAQNYSVLNRIALNLLKI